jgi:predicted transcriptional regulator
MNPWGTNPSSKRRDKLYIVAEILEIAKEGVLKTQIMYRANLSFTQLNDYLGFMLKNELLYKNLSSGKEVYRATEKGVNFLQRYHEITGLLKAETENCKNGIKIPPEHLLKRNNQM